MNEAIEEKGAVIPLIAISLIMIFSMLALVFDFGSMSIAKSDMRDTARAAAIAGLQAYVQDLNARIERNGAPPSINDPMYAQALNVAVEQASAVAQLNLRVSKSTGLRKGLVEDHSDVSLVGAGGSGGYLQAGTWHFIETAAGRPSCSPPAPQPFEPCFEVQPSNQAANAIRVVLTDDGGAVRGTFGRAAGIPMQKVNGFGTAAFIPRQGVVAFDLSASVTRVSHASSNSAAGKSSEYAFYIDPLRLGAGLSCGSAWESGLQSTHQGVWDNMWQNPAEAGAAQGPKDHFKDDYQCLSIPVDGDSEYFAIETQGSPDPQPLNSILDATHFLLESFAGRRVVGDRVGAFGFDLEVLPQRRLPETAIAGRLLAEPVSGEAAFAAFLDATDTSIPITDDVRKNKFLFPRVYTGSPSASRREIAVTNIQDALKESLGMLKSSDTFDVADNFVLLISDGLSNCVEDLGNAPLRGEDIDGDGSPDPIRCFSTNDSNFWNYNEQYIRAAFDEIYDPGNGGITDQYVEDGVKIHVALVGENVGPHTLVRSSESGGCMDFNEASAVNLSMFDGSNTPPYTPTGGGSFYFPNNFASVSAATNGLWWPIRPPCGGSLDTPLLESICDANIGSDPITPTIAASLGFPITGSNWDNNGRLLCNPSGGSVGDQLRELVEKIMADSPIVLVE
jgi:hypothetical protein